MSAETVRDGTEEEDVVLCSLCPSYRGTLSDHDRHSRALGAQHMPVWPERDGEPDGDDAA